MNYSISELTRLNKKRMNSKQPYILCYNLWLHREFCFFFLWLRWDSDPKTFRTFFWPHSAKCHQRTVTF